MSDLNSRLDRALQTVDPGTAPVEAVIARGRKIRIRRRAAVLAGSVAVIAAAVVSVPALAHHQALPGPASTHVRITVNPPGPHAPAGTIATGLIGRQPWNLRVESPGTKNCVITGIDLAYFGCDGDLPQADASEPITLAGTGTGSDQPTFFVSYGVLRQDVTSVRVLLANGTVLTPRPVTVAGRRWVAFANPGGVTVTSVTAYSRAGRIATAIPFDGPAGDEGPTFVAWLRPGQVGQARATRTFAAGTVNGQAWQLTGYAGPWGTCIRGGNGGACFDPRAEPKGRTSELGWSTTSTSATLVFGLAAESVSYLIVTPANGAAIHVDVTAVGQRKYYGFALDRRPRATDRWTAYNSAGQPVSSGTLS